MRKDEKEKAGRKEEWGRRNGGGRPKDNGWRRKEKGRIEGGE